MTVNLNYIGISNSAGLKPVNAVLSTYKIIAGSLYVNNNSGGVIYTLPVSARLGTVFSIVGKVGTWKIAQGANQQIVLGTQGTTVGTGGSLSSTSNSDSVQLVCTTSGTSTVWRVTTDQGSLTFV